MLKGKTALISGASRGIGRAVLEEFARQGCCVIAGVRKENAEFSEFLKKLGEECQVGAQAAYFDLANSESVKAAVRELAAQKRDIDILVNCAGVAHGGLFQMTSVSKIREVFEVNVFGQMELTQMVLKIMARKKSGCVINFASVLGVDNYAGQCAYGASKAALIRWTQTLAAELGASGVRVNAIAPGLTDTEMASLMDEKTRLKMLGHSALGRAAKPQDVARVAAFLASADAAFINGEVIRTDGGLVL